MQGLALRIWNNECQLFHEWGRGGSGGTNSIKNLPLNFFVCLARGTHANASPDMGLRSEEQSGERQVKVVLITSFRHHGISRVSYDARPAAFLLAYLGAHVAYKTWCGHQFMMGIICPRGWKRVNVASKTCWGLVPLSLCPQARLKSAISLRA